MKKEKWAIVAIILFVVSLFLLVFHTSTASSTVHPLPLVTPSGHIASNAELTEAQAEWAQSGHAETYDNGMGANTTCARCKSPRNWDPNQDIAQQEALNCNSCKRVPGAPRPELLSGVPVDESDWRGVPCDICHIPANNSYYTGIAFWDQSSGQYIPVENSMELCAHCHEGQHGFEVVEEQKASLVHANMVCTDCHGSHGSPSACRDCHNPALGAGAPEHVRHLNVNCTACHDAGGLSIWLEKDPNSAHFGEFITRRFAHTLTSWPSHNLQRQVECQRCHHPKDIYSPATAPDVSCLDCHPDGASLFWCVYFHRNPDPNPETKNQP